MKIHFYGFLFLVTLVCSALLGVLPSANVQAEITPDVFVGIDLAYGGFDQIKEMVDEVSSYTNLFVLGCTGVTQNKLELEKACQYLFDMNLFFIVYQDYPLDFNWFSFEKSSWIEDANTRWGIHFMGFYYADEVGGRQLDLDPHWTTVKKPTTIPMLVSNSTYRQANLLIGLETLTMADKTLRCLLLIMHFTSLIIRRVTMFF
jgi:hypothetical protein